MKRLKLVCVGDGQTGKTCMLITFAKDEFPAIYVPTVFENYIADITVDDKTYELNLWDTAGQEDLDRLRPLSYPDSHVVLICFAIDSHMSYDNVKLKWIKEVRHYCPKVPILLVGLKTDLRTDEKVIETLRENGKEPITNQQGESLGRDIKAWKYVECSAKTGDNLKFVFEQSVRAALEKPTNSGHCLLL
ncbi:gtp-binding protein rho4 [Anaeramoeba ignava]|uniref:Gtp-binding protein rho4 n=1 Tax=Anaeramoeba ignava TaxID=1746090 RepID=A0A9Q0LR66_ANAIG|nr:gtp-binding protein rho4 [Anaeramoeba ignava]|eukprot:Anaeramoba_ignava/a608480_241.p1 GENE.a608480_241~~a608480_241.p1  ORF type:complete len:190 (-),score=50.10 a608480_241:170-739(-)